MAIMMPVDIESLTEEAKLDLISQLWDSIESGRRSLPYTQHQRELVAERRKAHQESPQDEMSLEEFQKSMCQP